MVERGNVDVEVGYVAVKRSKLSKVVKTKAYKTDSSAIRSAKRIGKGIWDLFHFAEDGYQQHTLTFHV